MWRNYFTVGFRALAKNRTYAFINIVGLAIGLAACLMILLYVRYERSYDEWLPGHEHVYQMQTHFQEPESSDVAHLQMTPYVAGATLQRDFPEVTGRVYVRASGPTILRNGQALPTENVGMVDGTFFDVVPLPMVDGDPRTALRDAGSLVLTETEARKYFGDANPMGQTLTFGENGTNTDYRITGVLRDLPRNSHMRFTMLARIDPVSYFGDNQDFLTQWGFIGGWTYLKLRPGTDPDSIHSRMAEWERRNIPDQRFGDRTLNQGEIGDWDLVNIADVHLGRSDRGAMAPINDSRTIITFAVVAFLILGMACVNFTNLATARASQRAREVALRKVLGANRRQLVTQFLAESILVAGIAMLLALTMAELLLPLLSNFLDADLAMNYWGADGMLLPILLLVLVVGAAGGIYPAFYLSRFQPAQVLRANKSSAEASGSGILRSALVIGQFAVSIGLIICTAVVYAQTVHARSADPGFRREGILQVSNLGPLGPRGEPLAREVERIAGVESVGRSSIAVSTTNVHNTVIQIPGRELPVSVGNYAVDANFFQTMGVQLIAGRFLDRNRPMDNDWRTFESSVEADNALVGRGLNIVVNEMAARRLGFNDPRGAIGAQFAMGLGNPELGLTPITIVGVVRDTRFRSIRQELEPMAFRLSETGLGTMVVRYDSNDPNGARDRIEQVWRRHAPEEPFEANFTEELVAELYVAEQSRAQIFAGFALLAIIVACLGLFGLAAFTAERRTKEIGIRKVLGARTRDIVRLLTWQFSKPVMIANLIAWPAAFYLMRDWLKDFDTRIDLGPTPFLAAGLLALVIAILTIAGHAVKVARANPIHALRYE